MYSENRSGGQGYWGGGGAEGPAPAGPLSPAPLFSPGAYERLALLLGSLGLLGVGSNLLVLVLYYKFPRLRSPTHLCLANISLSDLLASLFGVTFTFVSCLRNGWVWDAVGCVWDGFGSSLFGESAGREASSPLQTSLSASPPSLCVPGPTKPGPSPFPPPPLQPAPAPAGLPSPPALQSAGSWRVFLLRPPHARCPHADPDPPSPSSSQLQPPQNTPDASEHVSFSSHFSVFT